MTNRSWCSPKGTRTEDGKLREFKDGAFQAAVLTGKPVVPVALNGTFTLMSRDEVDTGGSKNREDRLVTVQIGKPLYPNAELEDEEAVARLAQAHPRRGGRHARRG